MKHGTEKIIVCSLAFIAVIGLIGSFALVALGRTAPAETSTAVAAAIGALSTALRLSGKSDQDGQ